MNRKIFKTASSFFVVLTVMTMIFSIFSISASAKTVTMGDAFGDKSKWEVYDGEDKLEPTWKDDGLTIVGKKNDIRFCYVNENYKIPDGDTFKFKMQIVKNPFWVCVLFRNSSPTAGIWDTDYDTYGIQITNEGGIAIVKWAKGGAYENLTPNPEDKTDNLFLDKAIHDVEILTQNVNNNTGVKISLKIDGTEVKSIVDSKNPILNPGHVVFHALHEKTALAPVEFSVWAGGPIQAPPKTDSNGTTTTTAKPSPGGNTTEDTTVSTSDATTTASTETETTSTIEATKANGTTTKSTTADKKEKGSNLWIIILIIAVVLAGGGVALFFLVIKPRMNQSGNIDE